MNIKILHTIEGAKAARGLTVIIDVFRAFSVEAYFFSRGVKAIIPVGDATLAYRLKEENPQMLLAGERHGKKLPGFDVGNSPAELMLLPDVCEKTVIHTTSAGTQGIANAVFADEILGGSLVTAKATANYIKKSDAKEVSLVCMGLMGETETEEDTLCAHYIKSLLTGETICMEKEIDLLKTTSGAKFFDPAQNAVFPQADFDLCTRVNLFDFVLQYQKTDSGIGQMVKLQ